MSKSKTPSHVFFLEVRIASHVRFLLKVFSQRKMLLRSLARGQEPDLRGAGRPEEAGGEDRDDRAVDEEGHRQREEGLHREPRSACAAWITPAREKAGAGANEMSVRNSTKSRKLNERYQKHFS